MQTKLTRTDMLVLSLCLALALCLTLVLLLPRPAGAELVITDHATGREWIYPLSVDRKVQLEAGGHHLTVVITKGQAHVAQADCPDGLCMSGGAVGRAGETLVCVPAGLTLHIRRGEEVDADAVIG